MTFAPLFSLLTRHHAVTTGWPEANWSTSQNCSKFKHGHLIITEKTWCQIKKKKWKVNDFCAIYSSLKVHGYFGIGVNIWTGSTRLDSLIGPVLKKRGPWTRPIEAYWVWFPVLRRNSEHLDRTELDRLLDRTYFAEICGLWTGPVEVEVPIRFPVRSRGLNAHPYFGINKRIWKKMFISNFGFLQNIR